MTKHELAARFYFKNMYPGSTEESARVFANDCILAAEYFFSELDKHCGHATKVNGVCANCGLEIL